MSCPICGPICHCDQRSEVEQYGPMPEPVSRFPDPDAYDASEQQFAASLAQNSPADHNAEAVEAQIEALASDLGGHVLPEDHNDSAGWKQELAAKLDDYRSRHKPKPPRYPSLQLKFETEEPAWSAPAAPSTLTYATRESNALDHAELAPVPEQEEPGRTAETTGRLIAFPRSANVPTAWLDALADPVMERPRILEVPESDFLPPALGGISMEPAAAIEEEKRPGIEIPMLTAPMWRRIAAGALDSAIIASAVALSGYIFFSMAGAVLALRPLIEGGVVVTACLWAAYHYLLVVYSGTTYGLKAAGLELSRFDGSAVPRKLRRWRVLASVLSGVSLCLGYAWCYLDEDRLCWHDRITKTYMAPKP